MYCWSALRRLWWAVKFARGTAYEKSRGRLQGYRGYLGRMGAAALETIYRLKRPPVIEKAAEIYRADILKEGWPTERPGLPEEN